LKRRGELAMEGSMRRVLAILLFCVFIAAPVPAQDQPSADTLRAAQDLASILTSDSMKRMTEIMTSQMWPQVESQFNGKVDGATLAELLAEFEKSLTAFTGEVMKDATAIYARYFSAQELHEMVAFYKSPTGLKALHEMPQVMGDVMNQMVPRMQVFQADLKSRIAAVMQKQGYKN
jgi:hypothetical protein